MAEEDVMAKMNEVYNDILGEGRAIKADNRKTDGAYEQEDYSDDDGLGKDPREEGEIEEEVIEDDDDDADDPLQGQEDSGDDYEEIPDRLVNAGRAANLSDEAIVELAESRPEALEALARAQEAAMQATRPVRTEESAETKEKPAKDPSAFEPLKLDFNADDEEEMGSKALTIIKTLVDKVNTLGGQLQVQSEGIGSIQKESEQEKIRMIDSYFDKASKDVPTLGTVGNLTEEQKANRRFAFNVALSAKRTYGNISDEEALAIGANALKGQMKDAQVKQNLVRDLDKNKKRFIQRGLSRNRPESRRSTEERAMSAINRVLDKQY